MADSNAASAPAAPATTAVDPAVASATSPSKLTIPQFASEIRKRKPGYDGLADDVLVREVLARRPDYTQYIQTAEPRPRLKNNREPSFDQRTQKFFENHPKIREAALGAASGLGIPESLHPVADMAKGFVHTVADAPQTTDEQALVSHDPNARILLPAYRMVKGIIQQTYGYGQEAFDSIDWGKMKFKPGDEGAPKTAHALAGLATEIVSMIAGGKKVPEAGEAAVHAGGTAAKVVTEGPTVTAQRMAGTGPRLATKVAEGVVEESDKAAAGAAKAKTEFTDKLSEHRAGKVEASRIETQHEGLKRAQAAAAEKAIENAKSTHKAVRSALDQRWNGLREKVGVDAPVEAPPLYSAVESGRAMLAGVPADLKIFNDIVKEVTEKGEKVENERGELQGVPKQSIPFDDARTQYSVIGEKAYAADGIVRKALFQLYDAYDKALNVTANKAGAGADYTALKRDWKSYMQDWHDMSGQATGGSPLARLYRANPTDVDVAKGIASGKFGNRLLQTMGKYRKFGADPELAQSMRKYVAVEKALPNKVKVPPKPEYTSPGPVRPPNLEDIIQKTKEAKIEQAKEAKDKSLTLSNRDAVLGGLSAAGVFGLHNISWALPYMVARVGEAVLVSSEMGQRWLSRITPQDIAAINEVLAKAPDKRVPVQNAITQGLVEKARKGEKLPPLNTFSGLLSRAQMGAILKVAAPPAVPAGQQQQPPQQVQ
ncbi:MAG TPA: hypothetical protein VN861_03320 [Candidatus Acidoferrales bacterium]|nr:hypothetical protein [Candidatus Acidoferrales bacterium]